MKLSSLFTRPFKWARRNHPVVIFDIGSASIGGAVVYFNKEVPQITYTTRVRLPFQEEADGRHLLPHIEEILSQVARSIQKDGLQPKGKVTTVPREVVCIFSSLWSNTQTTGASFQHKERFEVTDTILDNLLAQVHEKNKEGKTSDSVTIEEIIINSLLNGYPTQYPVGKEVQSIYVTLLESSITKELHTKIQDILYTVFNPDIPLLLRSFTLAAFSVTRDTFEDIKDFLLVDVTGEITGLAVVRDSTLGDTLSFPYGRNSIVRDIARRTKSVPEDVLARIKIAGSSNESTIKRNSAEEDSHWIEMFGKACEELSSENNPLPQTVFLVVDSDFSKWFSDMIEKVDFSQFTATREAFQVILLIGKQASGTYTLDSGVSHDSFLIIDSLFYNREYLARRS